LFEFPLGKIVREAESNPDQAELRTKKLYRFLATPGVEVVNLMFDSDRVVWASWRYTAAEQAPSLRHTNEVVAA